MLEFHVTLNLKRTLPDTKITPLNLNLMKNVDDIVIRIFLVWLILINSPLFLKQDIFYKLF